MVYTIDYRSATAHRITSYRAIFLVCQSFVVRFDIRNKLLEEIILIHPFRVVKPYHFVFVGFWACYNHSLCQSVVDKTVCHFAQVGKSRPVGICATSSMQKIQYRIFFVAVGIITWRQIDGEVTFRYAFKKFARHFQKTHGALLTECTDVEYAKQKCNDG